MSNYSISVRERNRCIRSELFDNGMYTLVRKYNLLDVPLEVIQEYTHMKALQVNRWKRVHRLKQHVTEIVTGGPALFLTLTFTDDVLSSTSPATRRKYVTRALGAYKVPYVANIDYGTDDRYTKREHYHALISLQHIDNRQNKAWTYGSMEIVRCYNRNSKRLARYITKLTAHAIKYPSRIVYARFT